jgi:hypothetical protein
LIGIFFLAENVPKVEGEDEKRRKEKKVQSVVSNEDDDVIHDTVRTVYRA